MARTNGRATSKTNVASSTERTAQMWKMRVDGATTTDIAAEFGISQSLASRILSQHAKELVYPHVSEYREEVLSRIQFMWRALIASGKLDKGDPNAIAAGVRLLDRMSKLLGLDAPTKVEADITNIDPRELELHQLITAARAKADAEIKAIQEES